MSDDSRYAEAQSRLRAAQDSPRAMSPEEVTEALRQVLDEVPSRPTGLSMPGVSGAPDWFAHEMTVWQVGEMVRHYLLGRRELRGRQPLLDTVLAALFEPSLGKGRQAFVLVLRDMGRGEYCDEVAPLIDDDEISAHVLGLMTRAGRPGFETRAQEMLSGPLGVHRSAAKKYLKKLGSTSTGNPS